MDHLPLHKILCDVLEAPFPDGLDHCYYNPPNGTQLRYPCIVYKHDNNSTDYADNKVYRKHKRYSVTIIDEDEDSLIPSRLEELSYCSLNRTYAVDGLHHFVYNLFFNGPRLKEEEDE